MSSIVPYQDYNSQPQFNSLYKRELLPNVNPRSMVVLSKAMQTLTIEGERENKEKILNNIGQFLRQTISSEKLPKIIEKIEALTSKDPLGIPKNLVQIEKCFNKNLAQLAYELLESDESNEIYKGIKEGNNGIISQTQFSDIMTKSWLLRNLIKLLSENISSEEDPEVIEKIKALTSQDPLLLSENPVQIEKYFNKNLALITYHLQELEDGKIDELFKMIKKDCDEIISKFQFSKILMKSWLLRGLIKSLSNNISSEKYPDVVKKVNSTDEKVLLSSKGFMEIEENVNKTLVMIAYHLRRINTEEDFNHLVETLGNCDDFPFDFIKLIKVFKEENPSEIMSSIEEMEQMASSIFKNKPEFREQAIMLLRCLPKDQQPAEQSRILATFSEKMLSYNCPEAAKELAEEISFDDVRNEMLRKVKEFKVSGYKPISKKYLPFVLYESENSWFLEIDEEFFEVKKYCP